VGTLTGADSSGVPLLFISASRGVWCRGWNFKWARRRRVSARRRERRDATRERGRRSV